MIFAILTEEQDQELTQEMKTAKNVRWFKRLSAVRMSSKKSPCQTSQPVLI